MKQRTRAIHATQPDPLTGSITTPIYQTSTFEQESPGLHKGFDYSRSNNPTRKVLEDLIARLEHGSNGLAFSSGLAAIDAVLRLLNTGDHIVAVDDIYGGTYRLLHTVYKRFGVEVTQVDTSDLSVVQNAIQPNTKFLWIETPTNPTLQISDVKKLSELAHAHGLTVVVDNTFASPVGQNPILQGADVIVHSATKYLAGHSDVIAGLVVTDNEELGNRIKYIQNASGAVLAPFDCWLTIRGIQTLGLRYAEHSKNAQVVAESLLEHPLVDQVHYPGLKSHPGHELAEQQQTYFGGIVAFTLKDDLTDLAKELLTQTELFKLAESLGGVKSLACHPASMTHASVPKEARRSAGIKDSLIRLSVGLEAPEDLVNDLYQSLERISERRVDKQVSTL